MYLAEKHPSISVPPFLSSEQKSHLSSPVLFLFNKLSMVKMILLKIIHMKILVLRGRVAFQFFLSGRSIPFLHIDAYTLIQQRNFHSFLLEYVYVGP